MIDPVNRCSGLSDIGITSGKIAEVAEDLDPSSSAQFFDVKGLHVLPGLIDLHVHVSSWLGGGFGHRMMAEAGVTTALDMSGPVESVLELAREHGAGLNLACLQYVRPGHTVRNINPERGELEELLQDALVRGAYGLKILGGHYPLSPEATARAIEVTRTRNAYLAFHAGSLETQSDLGGMLEAVDLICGHRATLAHINSYCRGRTKPCQEETEEALSALESNPNICSESYLSPFNGTSAKCSGGVPESRVTLACLAAGGFEGTQKGLEEAILNGWAHINMEGGGRVTLGTGAKAAAWWRGKESDCTVSFAVNPDTPRLRLATARRKTGQFAVDAIITDGGGIPRNVSVEAGLSLVKLAGLSVEEFVLKTSYNPAQILGLQNKGQLGVGSDADITVVDLESQKPVLSLSNGKVIMFKGYACGTGTRMITTPLGEASVKEHGLEPLVVDPSELRLHYRPQMKAALIK